MEASGSPKLPPTFSSPVGNPYLTNDSALPFRPRREGVETQVAVNITPQNTSLPEKPQPPFSRNERPNNRPTSFSPTSPHPPLPSMNNSSKKILQVLGHDPSLDRVISRHGHNPVEWRISPSSSVYSVHEEEGNRYSYINGVDDNELVSSPNPGKEPSQAVIRPQTPPVSRWSFSDDEKKPTAKVAEERKSSGPKSARSTEGNNPDGLTTLNEMLYEELQRDVQYPVSSKYRREFADLRAGLPLPPTTSSKSGDLKGRTKSRPRPIVVETPKKPSYFVNNTRESFAWGSG